MELCQLNRKYFEVYRLKKRKKKMWQFLNLVYIYIYMIIDNFCTGLYIYIYIYIRGQFILLERGKQIQAKLKWDDMPVRAQG